MKSLRNLSVVRVAATTAACLAILSGAPGIATAADHAKYTVKYSDFGKKMKDGDTISVKAAQGGCAADEIRITLKLGRGITWWKGIMLFKKDVANDYLPVCSLQER